MKSYMLPIVLIATFFAFATSQSGLAAQEARHEHRHEDYQAFSLLSLVKPLGICALSSLLITLVTGLSRRKLGRQFLKVHKILAFLTVIIALCHGILVLVLF